MADRKNVSFTYDTEKDDGKITANWSNNVIICNDGKCGIQGNNIDVLGYKMDGSIGETILTSTKECLEEMLALVNKAIENS